MSTITRGFQIAGDIKLQNGLLTPAVPNSHDRPDKWFKT